AVDSNGDRHVARFAQAMRTLSPIAAGCSDPGRRALAAIRGSKGPSLCSFRTRRPGNHISPTCGRPPARSLSERTRTTEFDLLVRDAAKANCRHDVEEWRDAVSAAAWSQSIGGEVGHEGRL